MTTSKNLVLESLTYYKNSLIQNNEIHQLETISQLDKIINQISKIN